MLDVLFELLKTRVTRSGTAWKQVECESCKHRYEYAMQRKVKMEGFSAPQALARDAETTLQMRLAKECEPVACPSCGWFQRDMVLRMRRDYLGFSFWPIGLALGALPSFLAVLLAGPAGPDLGPWWAGACILSLLFCLVGIPVFYGYRIYKRFSYNPNVLHFKCESDERPALRR